MPLVSPVMPNSIKIKLKVKVDDLYSASTHEVSLKCSGIARIVKGYHSFTYTR